MSSFCYYLDMLLTRLKIELLHFFALSKKAQRLLISYFFMSASYPIIGTFINAYIFKNKGDILLLIIYNLGQFGGVSLAFFLNGLLLKKYNIKVLYFFGTLLLGIASLLIVFYPGNNLLNYFFYGLILGIGGGFHWGNRSYLTMSETHSHNRTYFTGLNFTVDTITAIVVSFVVGWLLVWGLSYQMLMAIAFLFLFCAGYIILRSDYQTPKVNRIEVKKPTNKWWAVRWLELSIGTSEGIIFFFPSFLILSYLGHEGILGTLTATASLISAFIIYIYSRKSLVHHQFPGFIFSLVLGLITSVIFALFFSKIVITFYVLFVGFVLSFMWLNGGPMIMDRIDREIKNQEGEKYSFIFDGEVYLNIGRSLSLLTCLTLFFIFGLTAALRFSPLILYSFQAVIVFFLTRKLL